MKCFRCNRNFEYLQMLECDTNMFCKSCVNSWNKLKAELLSVWKNEKYWNVDSPYDGVLYKNIPQTELKKIYKEIEEGLKQDIKSKLMVDIEVRKNMLKHLKEYIIN